MIVFIKKHKVFIFVVIGFLIAFVLPAILIRPSFTKFLDFSTSGQIGDTIGGIAGPILNFVGLILVYFSFQQQLKANNLQLKLIENEKEKNFQEKNFQTLLNLFNNFKDQSLQIPIKEIFHKYPNKECDEVFVNNKTYTTLEVKYLLDLAVFFLEKLEELNISLQDKEYFNTIFISHFYSNYDVFLRSIKEKQEICNICKKIHHTPKVLKDVLVRIKKKILIFEKK